MLKSLYLMPLPIHKMLLQSYEADIKQISSGNNNITIFWVIFAGIALKLQSTPILVIHGNRRQETVSMPKCSIKYKNCTIMFGIQLMRKQVLAVKKRR